MSNFYNKYKSLFEGGSNIVFPSQPRKFSNEYGYAYMKSKDINLGGLKGFGNKIESKAQNLNQVSLPNK